MWWLSEWWVGSGVGAWCLMNIYVLRSLSSFTCSCVCICVRGYVYVCVCVCVCVCMSLPPPLYACMCLRTGCAMGVKNCECDISNRRLGKPPLPLGFFLPIYTQKKETTIQQKKKKLTNPRSTDFSFLSIHSTLRLLLPSAPTERP